MELTTENLQYIAEAVRVQHMKSCETLRDPPNDSACEASPIEDSQSDKSDIEESQIGDSNNDAGQIDESNIAETQIDESSIDGSPVVDSIEPASESASTQQQPVMSVLAMLCKK